jgi:anthraniloyl-CoA monooxygenase
MRITVVGGGPAGLFFALLAKLRSPLREVTVLERHGPGETAGSGLVLSQKTLGYFEDNDRACYRQLTAAAQGWENICVSHASQRELIGGNRLVGIARISFLDILRRRCMEERVRIRFRTQVATAADIPDSDLVVGADGADSSVRAQHAEVLRPTIESGRNRYLALTTRWPFHALTFAFRPTALGLFVAGAHKYDAEASAFVVEAVGEAWQRAGFAERTEAETLELLSSVFAPDLHGAPLHLTPSARWRLPVTVRNERWCDGRLVLIGDALHTVHYSIGSGTRAALEDAIALADSLDAFSRVDEALQAFERTQQPRVQALHAAGEASQRWFEAAEAHLGLSSVELAYAFMTRTGRIDQENLRQRDPDFVARWERATGQIAGA